MKRSVLSRIRKMNTSTVWWSRNQKVGTAFLCKKGMVLTKTMMTNTKLMTTMRTQDNCSSCNRQRKSHHITDIVCARERTSSWMKMIMGAITPEVVVHEVGLLPMMRIKSSTVKLMRILIKSQHKSDRRSRRNVARRSHENLPTRR